MIYGHYKTKQDKTKLTKLHTMQLCIYRSAKKLGMACDEYTVHDTPFCSSHRRCGQQVFFENTNIFMNGSSTSKLDADNIYACLDSLWTNKKSKKEDLGDAFTAIEVINHLCDHQNIINIGEDLRIPLRKQKMAAIFDIVTIMWDVWHVGQNPKVVAAISFLKRRWRMRSVAELQGPYPSILATNDVDPFTLEALDDLPPESVFSYWENVGLKWRVYAFSGKEFYDYVYIHGNNTNPLTRNPIRPSVFTRLSKWHTITCVKPPSKEREQEQAQTPSVAFTEVASELYHRHHINVEPQWLTSISETGIMQIYDQYHRTVDPVSPSAPFMDDETIIEMYDDMDLRGCRMTFAKDMLTLIRQEASPSFFVCALMCAIANASSHVRNSLPEWIYDAIY